MRRQVGERTDDAEHRAEQPDERSVVPQRAEDEQPALVLQPSPVDGRRDRLLDRRLPARGDPRGRAHHLGFHRVALGELRRLVQRSALAEPEQLGEPLGHAALPEIEPALQHHGDRQD